MIDKSDAPDGHQERLASLSLDLLCVTDRDAMFVAFNPRWTQLLGWSDSELLSQPMTSLVHPGDVEETERLRLDMVNRGETFTFENRLMTKGGEYHHIRWSAHFDESGRLYAAGRDISAQLSAESDAAEKGKMFQAVLDAAVDPIILIDSAGAIVTANPATSALFGYHRDEMVGQNVKMLMPEPFRSEHDGYLERYLRTGERRIIGLGREVVAQRIDGTTMPISLAVSEVDLPGSPPMFTGIIHDLTARLEAEQQLRAVNESLEERVKERTDELERSLAELSRSNRDLEQFAYIASHDLQTPLRNVRQGLELLDSHLQETVGSSFDEEADELRSLVVRAVGRMEDLINGLLAYARVQRAASVLHSPVDLNLLAEDVRDSIETDLVDLGATFEFQDLPTVYGNPAQLRQVLTNLVENSLKYRNDRTKTVVEIQAAQRDGRWVLSVCDNGIGLGRDQHERIFELFRRGHAGYDGVGIGLAICQRIVEQHGGEIWVESKPDEGATFNFTLPAAPQTVS